MGGCRGGGGKQAVALQDAGNCNVVIATDSPQTPYCPQSLAAVAPKSISWISLRMNSVSTTEGIKTFVTVVAAISTLPSPPGNCDRYRGLLRIFGSKSCAQELNDISTRTAFDFHRETLF